VERDPRFLGQDFDRPDRTYRSHNGVEESADLRRLPLEVMLEIVTAARVRLIAVRELAAASLASP
jgi:hypothetical protein